MVETTMVHARVPKKIKNEAKKVADKLGISLSLIVEQGLRNIIITKQLVITDSEVPRAVRNAQTTTHLAKGAVNHLALMVANLKKSDVYWAPILVYLGYERDYQDATLSVYISKYTESALNFWEAARECKDKKHDAHTLGLHHVALNAESKEQVDEFYELLKDIKADILAAPAYYHSYSENYYAVSFQDINGFKIEFAHTP